MAGISYEIDQGMVWRVDTSGRRAGTPLCEVGQDIAVVYDEDDHILHKVGKPDDVRGYVAAIEAKVRALPGNPDPDAFRLAVVTFPAFEATLEALAWTQARSGTMDRFLEKIAGMEDDQIDYERMRLARL